LGKDIKKIVAYYTNKFDSNNPFVIAENLNIQIFQHPLGRLSGYYKYLKHHKCIYINSDIQDENYRNMVMAHELGHAILDPKENCYFLNKHTLILSSKVEKRANRFAAELLLPDNIFNEYREYTEEQLSCITGLDINLIKLKNKY
jgi:Zn-dependent peptidase ImmA (M78 family)